jgi:hypothetical protein
MEYLGQRPLVSDVQHSRKHHNPQIAYQPCTRHLHQKRSQSLMVSTKNGARGRHSTPILNKILATRSRSSHRRRQNLRLTCMRVSGREPRRWDVFMTLGGAFGAEFCSALQHAAYPSLRKTDHSHGMGEPSRRFFALFRAGVEG